MSAKKLISKQRDETWAQLTKRFISNDAKYEVLFTTPLLEYFTALSKSIGTNIGYVIFPIIITMSHLLQKKKCKVEIREDYYMPLNLFGIFVGPPTTGKSSALKAAISNPFNCAGIHENIVSTSTASGLSKLFATVKSAFLVNAEISEFMLKILKADDENFSGASQFLCKLFTGESSSMNYATENNRVIDDDIAFSIVGATQVKSMAYLLSMMDTGNGLLDRFMFFVPSSVRPLPEEQMPAKRTLSQYPENLLSKIYRVVNEIDEVNPIIFYFDDAAKRHYEQYESKTISEFNAALKEGRPTKKSKTLDLIPRVAVAFHVLEFLFEGILTNAGNLIVKEDICLPTLLKAIYFIETLDEQKEIFCEFLDSISEVSKEVERKQPTLSDIAKAALYCPGRVLTFSIYRTCAKAGLRKIMKQEFIQALHLLTEKNCGTVETFRLQRSSHDSLVFIKKSFNQFDDSVKDVFGPEASYMERISKPLHGSITQSLRERLIDMNYI